MMFIANELHRKGFGQTLEAMARNGDRRMILHVVGKAGLGSVPVDHPPPRSRRPGPLPRTHQDVGW